MKKLRGIVLSGLAILLPTVIMLWVLYRLFVFLDGILRSLIAEYLGVDAPGIGVAAIVVIVLLTGLVTNNIVGRKLLSWYNSVLARIPVLSSIYRTLKQVSEALLQDNSRGFKKVGLVEFPRRGCYCVGFITCENMGLEVGGAGEETVAVYVPTSPNPTSGFTVIVPALDFRVLDMSVEEGIRMVVTAGMREEGGVGPAVAAARAKKVTPEDDNGSTGRAKGRVTDGH